jgi:hypothetical protein
VKPHVNYVNIMVNLGGFERGRRLNFKILSYDMFNAPICPTSDDEEAVTVKAHTIRAPAILIIIRMFKVLNSLSKFWILFWIFVTGAIID